MIKNPLSSLFSSLLFSVFLSSLLSHVSPFLPFSPSTSKYLPFFPPSVNLSTYPFLLSRYICGVIAFICSLFFSARLSLLLLLLLLLSRLLLPRLFLPRLFLLCVVEHVRILDSLILIDIGAGTFTHCRYHHCRYYHHRPCRLPSLVAVCISLVTLCFLFLLFFFYPYFLAFPFLPFLFFSCASSLALPFVCTHTQIKMYTHGLFLSAYILYPGEAKYVSLRLVLSCVLDTVTLRSPSHFSLSRSLQFMSIMVKGGGGGRSCSFHFLLFFVFVFLGYILQLLVAYSTVDMYEVCEQKSASMLEWLVQR